MLHFHVKVEHGQHGDVSTVHDMVWVVNQFVRFVWEGHFGEVVVLLDAF